MAVAEFSIPSSCSSVWQSSRLRSPKKQGGRTAEISLAPEEKVPSSSPSLSAYSRRREQAADAAEPVQLRSTLPTRARREAVSRSKSRQREWHLVRGARRLARPKNSRAELLLSV